MPAQIIIEAISSTLHRKVLCSAKKTLSFSLGRNNRTKSYSHNDNAEYVKEISSYEIA
jgi:hypothetical protein